MRVGFILAELILVANTSFLPQAFAQDSLLPTLASSSSVAPMLHSVVQMKMEAPKGFMSRQSIVLDEQLRMIGGVSQDGIVAVSKAPVQKFHFVTTGEMAASNPILIIDHIDGISTPEAHQGGYSQANHISSPTVLKINGVRIGYIYTEIDGFRVSIPKGVLRNDGFNTVEVQAGYYFMGGDTLAYDEVHFQRLSINY